MSTVDVKALTADVLNSMEVATTDTRTEAVKAGRMKPISFHSVAEGIARTLTSHYVLIPRPATAVQEQTRGTMRDVLTVNDRIIPNMLARDWEAEATQIEARLTRDVHNLEVARAALAYLAEKAERTPAPAPAPESSVVTALRGARELAWGRLRLAFDQAIAEAQEAEALAGNWTTPQYPPLVLSLAQAHRSFHAETEE